MHEVNTLVRAGDGVDAHTRDPLALAAVLRDRPGSPLPPGAVLPATTTAWDFNYRGDLTFLADARGSGAAAVDGWDYFVAGWGAALTAIAGRPLTGELLAKLGEAIDRK